MDLCIRILENLIYYKFLKLSQLHKLHSNRSKKTIATKILLLREKGFIGTDKYGYHPKYGRLENIHFIRRKGILYLKDQHDKQIENIKCKEKSKPIYQDLKHRTMTINCQIALSEEIKNSGGKIKIYDNYFERVKRNSSTKFITATKLEFGNQYVIPDSIFIAQVDGKEIIVCLELHNGYRVSRIENKLRMYARVLESGIASKKYNLNTNAFILNVYEQHSTMKACVERVKKDSFYTHLKNYYLDISYDNLIKETSIRKRKL